MFNKSFFRFQFIIIFLSLFITHSAFSFDVFEAKEILTSVDIKVQPLVGTETLEYRSSLILSDEGSGISPLDEDIVLDFVDVGFKVAGSVTPCFIIMIPKESIVKKDENTFVISDPDPKQNGVTARIENEDGSIVFADLTDLIQAVDLRLTVNGKNVDILVDVIAITGSVTPCFRPIASASGHNLLFVQIGFANLGTSFPDEQAIKLSGGV